MQDQLEYNRPLGNGRDERGAGTGLANTDPVATRGPMLGSTVHREEAIRRMWETFFRDYRDAMRAWQFLLQHDSDVTHEWQILGHSLLRDEAMKAQLVERARDVFTAAWSQTRVFKPAGQVVLFKKVMEDWGFNDQEAATLLGFETATDISEIYLGRKPVGHRDANDRLRAVLRIATDLDALFKDVDAIRDWLDEPQGDLGEATPRALFTEGSMENLLRVKYYVAYLSGR
jgi:hypothetical protein